VLGAGARIFKVPIEGGDAVAVVDKISADPAISPDGQTFAMIYRAAPAEANKLAVMKVAGGDPQFISDYPAQYGRFRWTVDGTGLAYADKHEGIGNIWIQPIDGSAPSQLTHWLPDPILAFDWSRDGKWFAFTKASLTSDVVWITDRGR
jgi:Tol biopolymer transport system component